MLQTPPPLSGANANDADHLVDTFGEYVARCVYSSSWQHRQAATRYMTQEVEGGRVQDLRQLVRYVVKGFKDKVAAVVLESSRLMQQMVAKGSRSSSAIVQAVMPPMLERLADGNSRIAVRFLALQFSRRWACCYCTLHLLGCWGVPSRYHHHIGLVRGAEVTLHTNYAFSVP